MSCCCHVASLHFARYSWYQDTPQGRITSRFTTDLGVVDIQLSLFMDNCAQMSSQCVAPLCLSYDNSMCAFSFFCTHCRAFFARGAQYSAHGYCGWSCAQFLLFALLVTSILFSLLPPRTHSHALTLLHATLGTWPWRVWLYSSFHLRSRPSSWRPPCS